MRFHFAGQAKPPGVFADRGLSTPDSVSCAHVGSPKPVSIGSADAQDEKAIEQDKIFAAGSPAQRFSEIHIMQIDEEQLRPIVRAQLDENVVRVQVLVNNPAIVEMGNEFAKRDGEPLAHARRSAQLEHRQGFLNEETYRFRLLQASGDQKTLAGKWARLPFAQAERSRGRDVPICYLECTVE